MAVPRSWAGGHYPQSSPRATLVCGHTHSSKTLPLEGRHTHNAKQPTAPRGTEGKDCTPPLQTAATHQGGRKCLCPGSKLMGNLSPTPQPDQSANRGLKIPPLPTPLNLTSPQARLSHPRPCPPTLLIKASCIPGTGRNTPSSPDFIPSSRVLTSPLQPPNLPSTPHACKGSDVQNQPPLAVSHPEETTSHFFPPSSKSSTLVTNPERPQPPSPSSFIHSENTRFPPSWRVQSPPDNHHPPSNAPWALLPAPNGLPSGPSGAGPVGASQAGLPTRARTLRLWPRPLVPTTPPSPRPRPPRPSPALPTALEGPSLTHSHRAAPQPTHRQELG